MSDVAVVTVKATGSTYWGVQDFEHQICDALDGKSSWNMARLPGEDGSVTEEFEVRVELRRYMGMNYRLLGTEVIMEKLLRPLNAPELRILGTYLN